MLQDRFGLPVTAAASRALEAYVAGVDRVLSANTGAAELLQQESNPALYVSSVLTLYVDLPDTPLRASASDQWLARRLYDELGSPRVLLAIEDVTDRPFTDAIFSENPPEDGQKKDSG